MKMLALLCALLAGRPPIFVTHLVGPITDSYTMGITVFDADPDSSRAKMFFIDREVMCISKVVGHKSFLVIRGCKGTEPDNHAAGSLVFIAHSDHQL